MRWTRWSGSRVADLASGTDHVGPTPVRSRVDAGWGGQCHRGDLTGQSWSSMGSSRASGAVTGSWPGPPAGREIVLEPRTAGPRARPDALRLRECSSADGKRERTCRDRRPRPDSCTRTRRPRGWSGRGAGERASGGRTAPSARGLGGPAASPPTLRVVPRPGMPGPRGIRALVGRAHSSRVSGTAQAAGCPPPRPPPRRAQGWQGGCVPSPVSPARLQPGLAGFCLLTSMTRPT